MGPRRKNTKGEVLKGKKRDGGGMRKRGGGERSRRPQLQRKQCQEATNQNQTEVRKE